MDLERLADLARRAALSGGEVIRSAAGVTGLEEKGRGDYVTDTDRQAEAAILAVLGQEQPRVPVLAEEQRGTEQGSLLWAVDPLDGTTNFVHGFPVVGVSVALLEDGRPQVSCVHAPLLGLTFTAARGMGAWAGAHRLRVANRAVSEAVVATGFPFRERSFVTRYLPVFQGALATFEDLRRPGAASLDLAWTAAGAFDGFFELNLGTWDVAGGVLLVEEAGGVCSDWDGGQNHVLTGHILAGSPAVHAELVRLTAQGSSRQKR